MKEQRDWLLLALGIVKKSRGARVKIVVNFCIRKLNRLRMKMKILVNIRRDSTAFKEFNS